MSADPGAAERTYIIPPASEPSEPDPALAAGPDGPGPGGSLPSVTGSLASRIKVRREALEGEQTTTIDLPGYEGILAAEFRLLSWTESRTIARDDSEEPDEALRVLYITADCLLRAHVRFLDTGGEEPVEIQDTWHSLCERADLRLLTGATDRVAMIALLEDIGVMGLWAEYEVWRVTRGKRIAEAVVRDFTKTG